MVEKKHAPPESQRAKRLSQTYFPPDHSCAYAPPFTGALPYLVNSCCCLLIAPPLAVPQLGSRASSGRAWRLWAARHSREEAGPLGAQPLPRVLELAASKAADFPWPLTMAFDHLKREFHGL